METEDIVRVLRLVEYEGPRSLVEEQVAKSVHGTRIGLLRKNTFVRVTAVTIGMYPEVIEEARRVPVPEAITDLHRQLAIANDENKTLRGIVSDFRNGEGVE